VEKFVHRLPAVIFKDFLHLISRDSWHNFIDVILTTALRPGVDSTSNRIEYQNFLGAGGSKGGRCERLATLPPSCADCLEMIYDMIFIYCSWVSARWQWSLNLYKYGDICKGETILRTIQKHRILIIENKHTKQEIKMKRMLKNMSRVIRK
jgi:hypothetical protein